MRGEGAGEGACRHADARPARSREARLAGPSRPGGPMQRLERHGAARARRGGRRRHLKTLAKGSCTLGSVWWRKLDFFWTSLRAEYLTLLASFSWERMVLGLT